MKKQQLENSIVSRIYGKIVSKASVSTFEKLKMLCTAKTWRNIQNKLHHEMFLLFCHTLSHVFI